MTRSLCVAIATVALAGDPLALAVGPDDEVTTVRLTRRGERFAVARAIQGATRRLAHAECQGLLDEFADASGRPLRATLEAHAVSPGKYLSQVFFYDAPASACGKYDMAITMPGSRAVFVCGSRFARGMAKKPRYAEATIIHEMLHSLGLGENPPSSEHITSMVLGRCEQRGEALARAETPRP